jgi:hypothetical protein
MVSINIFAKLGDSDSLESAYNWPEGQLPAGKIIGKAGNSLLIQLEGDKVAVISAPVSDVVFKDNGCPKVDIQWAFE